MQKTRRSLIAIATFLFGCATGGAASHLVPAAVAQNAGPPRGGPRWSYYCMKEDDVTSISDIANRAGANGWELVASSLAGGHDLSSPIWCFKRPY